MTSQGAAIWGAVTAALSVALFVALGFDQFTATVCGICVGVAVGLCLRDPSQ